jgi:hypothetical protein
MYFCPKCNNSYDIARTTIDNQAGGKGSINYSDLVDKILDDDIISTEDVKDIKFNIFLKSSEYKKLSSKKKELIFNKIQDKLPDEKKILMQNKTDEFNESNLAFFVCNNCMYNKQIPHKTLIFSKTSENLTQRYNTYNTKNKIHSDILPLTRKYICPNKKCESHTNFEKKEAVLFRLRNSFIVKYICKTCNEMW